MWLICISCGKLRDMCFNTNNVQKHTIYYLKETLAIWAVKEGTAGYKDKDVSIC